MIYKVLCDTLHDKRYDSTQVESWTKDITDIIKKNLKGNHTQTMCSSLLISLQLDLELKRYKYVVQVVIGEQRGEGVK